MHEELKIEKSIVSVAWLHKNLLLDNVIVLNATIAKVTSSKPTEKEKRQIPNAIFFDLKKVFLNKEGEYPNTIPSEEYFEEQVQKLGINNNSTIVVYDDLGIYSSARVWWLFQTFGFKNIAVLNGGLPAWIDANYETENPTQKKIEKGNFKASFNSKRYAPLSKLEKNLQSKEFCVVDARSKDRFYAIVKEPREGVRGGHIPNSKSLPYTALQQEGFMKPKEELIEIFHKTNPENQPFVFSCGTGITACILALGLDISGKKNYAVYDGSWTEWGSITSLPIDK